eukprot:Seg3679.2 transcript_id=Seg3679.2/GoldUCD/mRNA.D3Y31 product="Pentraxin fusion protein" protein_id=Seg3679.2/GoldUCD/D3Y31
MNAIKISSNSARVSISLVLFLSMLNLFAQVKGQGGGTFYELLGGDVIKHKDMMVMKKFHQCSLRDDCSYVLTSTKFDTYKIIKSDQELQEELKDGAGHELVWKKMRIKPNNGLTKLPNFAKEGRTTHSSTVNGHDSAKAVDGLANTCTETQDEIKWQPHWWKLTFKKKVRVREVAIVTNNAIYHGKDTQLEIRVGDDIGINPLCKITRVSIAPSAKIKCGSEIEGKHMYIELHPSPEPLSLCEVQVFGSYVE